METINYKEFIDRYVLGQLNQEEKAWFEKEMNYNPELAREVKLVRRISDSIKDDDVLEFRSMLQEAGAEYKVTAKNRRLRKLLLRTAVAAAGIMIMLAMVFTFLSISQRPHSSQKIYTEFYSPYKSGLASRSSAAGTDVMYSRAVRYYEAAQYKEAIAVFDSIIQQYPDHHAALFFGGMAHMELKEFSMAAISFRKVIENGNSLYVQQAEWYRGLCLLVLNDRKNALEIFRSLAVKKGYYSSKATLIIKEMEKD